LFSLVPEACLQDVLELLVLSGRRSRAGQRENLHEMAPILWQ
jgi:hypothetical protein